MKKSSRELSCCAAAVTACACFAPAVCAQALSLSYALDPVHNVAPQRAAPLASRCSGLTWSALVAAGCPDDRQMQAAAAGVAAIPQSFRTHGAPAPGRIEAPAVTYANGESAVPFDLPALGTARTDSRLVRIMGGKDALASNLKNTFDFLFRFGTKYRMRSGDEGWEVYKFVDVTQENRLQSSRLKNLGVELVVPFQ